MEPLTALALASGAGKFIGGLFQSHKAKKLKPSTWVPPELRASQAEANRLSTASMAPGQQAEEESIRQSGSQYLTNIAKTGTSANEMQNFAGKAMGAENAMKRDIARRALLWKDQHRANLNAIRGRIAAQQIENRRQYQAAKSALRGAANQNIFGGLTDIAGAYLFDRLDNNNDVFGGLFKRRKSMMDYGFDVG